MQQNLKRRLSSTDQIVWSLDHTELPDVAKEAKANLVSGFIIQASQEARKLGFEIRSVSCVDRAHHLKAPSGISEEILTQFRNAMGQIPLEAVAAA